VILPKLWYSYMFGRHEAELNLKSSFETWITRNDVNGVSFIHFSYLITLLAYLWSQWTPNVQIKYFMFYCSIYILFVLYRAGKRDLLQIVLFVNVWSTCSIVEFINAFWDLNNKKWRKWCKFVSTFYLITLMAYLCSQCTPKVQIKYFMFDCSIYRQFVLNRGWKRDTLQIMILVYVCSKCSEVELKTHFQSWKQEMI
jgi:hypothetical protein